MIAERHLAMLEVVIARWPYAAGECEGFAHRDVRPVAIELFAELKAGKEAGQRAAKERPDLLRLVYQANIGRACLKAAGMDGQVVSSDEVLAVLRGGNHDEAQS